MNMINISKITISHQQTYIDGQSPECYVIVSYADQSHYCSTVVEKQNRFEWTFDKQIIKLTLQHFQPTIKIKLIDYSTCKTINEFQVQTKQINLYSKTKFTSKNKGKIELEINNQTQSINKIKILEQNSSYDRVSKKTSTTNYQQPTLITSQIHKLSSTKLITNRQLDYYNYEPYYSPKNTADYLKNYRQIKQTQRYESVLLQKSSSYKFLV